MKKILALTLMVPLMFALGCSRGAVGGAAVGAGAAGAAYEYQNKRAMKDIENEWREGKISKDDYLRRKREIEKKSLIY